MRLLTTSMLGLLLLGASACGGSNPKPTSGGDDLHCPDGSANPGKTIKTVNCGTVTDFDGSEFSASLKATKIAEAGLSQTDTVLRDITSAAEEMQIQFTQTCELFNSCNLTSPQFQERLDEAQKHFRHLREQVALLEAAGGNPEVLREVVQEMYSGIVPADKAAASSLALEFSIQARASGGAISVVHEGDTLKSGTEVVFGVRASQAAYVYIFQRKESGKLDVLFPNSEIGVLNPVAAGGVIRIPPRGQVFRLDNEDLGRETVYIAASPRPLTDLDAALNEAGSGTPESREKVNDEMGQLFADGNPECAEATRGFEVSAESGCGSMKRGMEIAESNSDDGFFGDDASVAARTRPGDDVLLQTFSFVHTE